MSAGLICTACSAFCFIFGTTVPFDSATLHALYPTHAAYVAAVGRAATRAARAGFLLRPDVKLIKQAAAAAHVPD